MGEVKLIPRKEFLNPLLKVQVCCMWILSSLAFYFAYIFVRLMSFSFNIFVSCFIC